MFTINKALSVVNQKLSAKKNIWKGSAFAKWQKADPKTKGAIGELVVRDALSLTPGRKHDNSDGSEIKTMMLGNNGKFMINRIQSDYGVIYLLAVYPDTIELWVTDRVQLEGFGGLRKQGRDSVELFGAIRPEDLSQFATLLHSKNV